MSNKYVVQSIQTNSRRAYEMYARVFLEENGSFKGFQFINDAAKATLCSWAEANFIPDLAHARRKGNPDRNTRQIDYLIRRVD